MKLGKNLGDPQGVSRNPRNPPKTAHDSYVLTVSPVNVVGRGTPTSVPYTGTEAGMHAMRQLATHAVNKIVMDQSNIYVAGILGQKAQKLRVSGQFKGRFR